ncbi:MAG: hypothetical protein M9921_03070 [Fimbriimonadaceae bacterium]|nr:hypothetical protein [Chthonomonadaceae bacterium]MCO5295815.1 hypothetical protein [Fimbriimonadaceae bacterium]
MKIWDYESGSTLSDVEITLTRDEASELASYLTRLVQTPSIGHAHLSEFDGPLLGRELTVALAPDAESLAG